MKNKNTVTIMVKNEPITISQSDFWYFKNLMNNISNYYSSDINKSKRILVKIPGTGQYKNINIQLFNEIKIQIDNLVSYYKKNLQLF